MHCQKFWADALTLQHIFMVRFRFSWFVSTCRNIDEKFANSSNLEELTAAAYDILADRLAIQGQLLISRGWPKLRPPVKRWARWREKLRCCEKFGFFVAALPKIHRELFNFSKFACFSVLVGTGIRTFVMAIFRLVELKKILPFHFAEFMKRKNIQWHDWAVYVL